MIQYNCKLFVRESFKNKVSIVKVDNMKHFLQLHLFFFYRKSINLTPFIFYKTVNMNFFITLGLFLYRKLFFSLVLANLCFSERITHSSVNFKFVASIILMTDLCSSLTQLAGAIEYTDYISSDG